jgi:hypothetical protein
MNIHLRTSQEKIVKNKKEIMIRKFTFLLILIFTISLSFRTTGQGLVIKTVNGSELNRQLSTVRTVTFNSSNLYINFNGTNSESYSLASVRKLTFKSVYTGINNITASNSSGKVSVYPNPVKDILFFQNLPSTVSDVMVYRIDGKLVMQVKISSDNHSMNVSQLTEGIYLLRVNNQVLKIIKL